MPPVSRAPQAHSRTRQEGHQTSYPDCYTKHMKRTNLVLDEQLLEQAVRTLGAKTYSAAVNTALEEVIRLRKIQSLPRFFHSGIWAGNLSEMREDQSPKPTRRPRQSR
jgi:Arc/MetJ family transcription regulator